MGAGMAITAIDSHGPDQLIWATDPSGQIQCRHAKQALPGDIPTGGRLIIGAGAALQLQLPGQVQSLPGKRPNLADLPIADLHGAPAYILPALGQSNPAALLTEGALALWGLIAAHPDFDGVICLCTKAQTHFVQISAAEVISITQAMTGQMIHAFGAEQLDPNAPDVLDAAADTISRPQALAQRLGSAQAAAQMGQISMANRSARIAGALIGADLAAARPYWLGQPIAMLDAGGPAQAYAAALRAQGAAPDISMTAATAGSAALAAFQLDI